MAKNKLKSAKSRFHVVIFQTGRSEVRLGVLGRWVVLDAQRKMDKKITTPAGETDIDLWLESGGGDANAAYKLNLDLRSRCSWIRAVIPDYAKSAATLLAIGADEIMMGDAADLGPLDVQIEHPTREGIRVSAIDVAKALEFVSNTAMKLAIKTTAAALRVTGLPRTDVMQITYPFAASLLSPVIDKLDPSLVHRAAQQLRISERYAIEMLRARKVVPQEKFDPTKLAAELVNNYPAHGFVISKQDSLQLGLPIKPAESHPNWNEMKRFHERFMEAAEGVGDVDSDPSCVLVLDDEEIKKING